MQNKLKIKLLSNLKGIILTRCPIVIAKGLGIIIEGAPDGVSVIFKNSNNNELYRVLKDSSCIVPNTFLVGGEMRVTVALLGTTDARGKVWGCETIAVSPLKSGEILIRPSDVDLPARCVQNELDIGELRETNNTLQASIAEINERLTSLIEGYDID